MNDELEEIEAELKNLKSFLYARFGKNINLEEDKWPQIIYTSFKLFELCIYNSQEAIFLHLDQCIDVAVKCCHRTDTFR